MKRLNNCDSGAVMVMGLFAGLLLVAIIYHVAGVGGSALENQLMQDAADSVTWSSATVKARGMNTIALINLVMATTLAVLVAIRLVQMVIGVAIVAVGVACVFTGGAACGAIAPLAQAEQRLSTLAEDLETPVKDVLAGLEKAADAVNKGVPILAQAEAVYISTRESPGVSMAGFVWPVLDELPTKPGKFEDLCEQAGRQVVSVSTFFLPGNLPEKADETVGEMIGAMAARFSRFFCGGGSSAPAVDTKQSVAYPLHNNMACDDEQARPSNLTGGCTTALCSQCARLACSECISRIGERDFEEGQWLVEEREWIESTTPDGTGLEQNGITSRELKWVSGDPCNNSGICGEDNVCIMEKRMPLLNGEGILVKKTSYISLYSCVVEERMDSTDAPKQLDGGTWPVHRIVDEDSTGDDFRMFGAVAGRNSGTERMRRLAVPLGSGASYVSNVRTAFAAAEFTSPSNDLWHMDWYPRLIRVRFPEEDESSATCVGPFSAECTRTRSLLDKASDLLRDQIVH